MYSLRFLRQPRHIALLRRIGQSVVGLAFALLSPFGHLFGAELNVFAAASLNEALTEIGRNYEQAGGDRVVFNFGASSTLARQIEQGAPCDLFFSADEAKLDALEKQGRLLPGTRRSLLSNTLVIVVASDARFVPKAPADLTAPQVKRLALAETATVPAGIYAREFLTTIGIWESVAEKVLPTESVRAALAAVESGNVEAAIVYKTDALISKKVQVAIQIPAAEGPKISYPLAIMKDSKAPEAARKFAAYLAGEDGRVVFQKLGFAIRP